MSKVARASDAEEMSAAPSDPRGICNLMLDEAEGHGTITESRASKASLLRTRTLSRSDTNTPLSLAILRRGDTGPFIRLPTERSKRQVGNRSTSVRKLGTHLPVLRARSTRPVTRPC